MFKKRIPTIIGLLLLLIGSISGVLFLNQSTDFLPRAVPEYLPQKVKITNISDTGFVVSWVTAEPTIGFIRYSDNEINLSQTATDDRDQLTSGSGNYRTHYVTLQNLTPGATYYFRIGSEKQQLYDDNGQPFRQALPPTTSARPPQDRIRGVVRTAVDTPAEGALVYLAIQNATPISALVQQNGEWEAILSDARGANHQDFAVYDPVTTQIDILVQPDAGDPTTATTTTANDQPVPDIILGQTNDFTAAALQPSPSASSTPAPGGSSNKFSLETIAVTDDGGLTITSLPTNGIISSPQPQLAGKAPPNTAITITVHSPQSHTAQVVSDATGSWNWLVPDPLAPGEHTVTLAYTDSSGQVHTTRHSFIIDSATLQQTNLSYTATPSATPKPSPTPKPTVAAATPTPTPSPTPKPTPKPTPTPTPKSSPLPSASPTAASPSATLPSAGNSAAGITVILFGSSLVLLGLIAKKLFPSW